MKSNTVIRIEDASGAGEARRQATTLAKSLGFSDEECGRLAIIATEAATNIARHAKSGAVLLRALEADGRVGLELTAIDTGPGIANLALAMQDGFSTAGTAGTGLGALTRLPSSFEIHSAVDEGTILTTRIWSEVRQGDHDNARFEYGVINIPKPGQDVCGDAWAVNERHGRALFMIADGLGHGIEAAHASATAVRAFYENADLAASDIIVAAHAALQPTRGAALAVAEVLSGPGQVRFAGLGNITAALYRNGDVRHMVSHDGTAGHHAHTISEFSYPWTTDTLLLMHSDGMSRRWKLEERRGLAAKHPSLIAAVLYAHHGRVTDDVTVLAARERSQN